MTCLFHDWALINPNENQEVFETTDLRIVINTLTCTKCLKTKKEIIILRMRDLVELKKWNL